MVSAVSSNAGIMPVSLGMGADPKRIADKIFARLDSEMMGILNAPDKAGARHASVETAVASKVEKQAGSQSSELSEADWKERAQTANNAYERQMLQIRVAQGGQDASHTVKQAAVAIQHVPATSMERSSTEFHAQLAGFVTPADVNGDGKITSKESLTYTAKLSSPMHTTPSGIVQASASNRVSEQSLQSYREMQQPPVGWTAGASSVVGLAA
jgi:hypothetical protein